MGPSKQITWGHTELSLEEESEALLIRVAGEREEKDIFVEVSLLIKFNISHRLEESF